MSKEKIKFHLSMKKCPICGKKFHPVPEHQWRIGGENAKPTLVCTYSCMRKYEKEHDLKRRGESTWITKNSKKSAKK